MLWIPLAVWIGVVVLALVVLGYGAYELAWKAKRLRTDLAALQQLGERATGLQREVAATQARIAAGSIRGSRG